MNCPFRACMHTMAIIQSRFYARAASVKQTESEDDAFDYHTAHRQDKPYSQGHCPLAGE